MSLSLPFALATSVTPPTPDAEIRAADDALAPAFVETRRNIHRHPELGNTLVWDCLARTR